MNSIFLVSLSTSQFLFLFDFLIENMKIFIILILAKIASAELLEVGNFQNYAHGIGGKVYLKDEKTLVIKDFTYDGFGQEALLWVGLSPIPTQNLGNFFSTSGKLYRFEDNRAPILSRRFNGKEITLTLPDNLKSTDLKWISVWSRKFDMVYGDVILPASVSSGGQMGPTLLLLVIAQFLQ